MQKQHASVLIPYRKNIDGEYEFYLQMRDANASESPNVFSFFGGGIEGRESPEDCLVREIKEELCIEINNFELFKKYKFDVGDRYVFHVEVGGKFENEVVVMEGEYGKFVTLNEALNVYPTSERARLILQEFCVKLL